ncbi:MAG: type II secretion system protein [Tindallia sp. MSAO_Bac2]|nr:MAG: type II secretion system protein [Tindallia sp. MSAO_Bac2]
MQFFAKRMKNRKGFTLIELIVVIAILGILAVIAVPRLLGFTSRAEDAAKDATLRTVQSAWTIYQADDSSGTWPGDYVENVTNVSGNNFNVQSNSGNTEYSLTYDADNGWSIDVVNE